MSKRDQQVYIMSPVTAPSPQRLDSYPVLKPIQSYTVMFFTSKRHLIPFFHSFKQWLISCKYVLSNLSHYRERAQQHLQYCSKETVRKKNMYQMVGRMPKRQWHNLIKLLNTYRGILLPSEGQILRWHGVGKSWLLEYWTAGRDHCWDSPRKTSMHWTLEVCIIGVGDIFLCEYRIQWFSLETPIP